MVYSLNWGGKTNDFLEEMHEFLIKSNNQLGKSRHLIFKV